MLGGLVALVNLRAFIKIGGMSLMRLAINNGKI